MSTNNLHKNTHTRHTRLYVIKILVLHPKTKVLGWPNMLIADIYKYKYKYINIYKYITKLWLIKWPYNGKFSEQHKLKWLWKHYCREQNVKWVFTSIKIGIILLLIIDHQNIWNKDVSQKHVMP